jgi:hypothetical protein
MGLADVFTLNTVSQVSLAPSSVFFLFPRNIRIYILKIAVPKYGRGLGI